MAAVSFEAVRKVYPDGTEAIPGLDLQVSDGEFMVLAVSYTHLTLPTN